jgi:hypothetical protein
VNAFGALFLFLALLAGLLGSANAYQALTGQRLSKRASVRSDELMRRQSAIAAAVLVPLALLVMALGVVIM